MKAAVWHCISQSVARDPANICLKFSVVIIRANPNSAVCVIKTVLSITIRSVIFSFKIDCCRLNFKKFHQFFKISYLEMFFSLLHGFVDKLLIKCIFLLQFSIYFNQRKANKLFPWQIFHFTWYWEYVITFLV